MVQTFRNDNKVRIRVNTSLENLCVCPYYSISNGFLPGEVGLEICGFELLCRNY